MTNGYDFVVLVVASPAGAVCDFCSSPNVVATHCCQPSVLDRGVKIGSISLTTEDSDGLWAACEGCDMLIRLEEWETLLRRSINTWEMRYGTTVPSELRSHIRKIHQGFAATRRREA